MICCDFISLIILFTSLVSHIQRKKHKEPEDLGQFFSFLRSVLVYYASEKNKINKWTSNTGWKNDLIGALKKQITMKLVGKL